MKGKQAEYTNHAQGESTGVIMRCDRGICLVLSCALTADAASAQISNKSTADRKRAIRVGIAATMNRSRHQGIPTWQRDQLIRELRRLRVDRKSSVVLEAVSLDASSRADASAEATRNGCQYFVLTTLLDPSHGPGISSGPDGVQPAPVVGNTDSNQTLAINYTILEVDSARTLAEGTSAARVEDNNDISATDEAMRIVAHRVASELRKDRPPNPD